MNKSYLLDYKRWSLNEAIIEDSNDIEIGLDFAQKLINRGFTKKEAAAISGNIWHESKFNPAAIFRKIERTPISTIEGEIEFIKSNQTAYGVMQWRAERKDALADFAKEKKRHPADLRLQADFMKYELKDSYDGKYAYETIMFQRAMSYGDSVKEKAKGFAEKSERSGGASPARIESAQIIYDHIS
jgi:hypothetical protein